jgi:hypothetical protein
LKIKANLLYKNIKAFKIYIKGKHAKNSVLFQKNQNKPKATKKAKSKVLINN